MTELSKLDHFALAALPALLADASKQGVWIPQALAQDCYDLAETLVQESAKRRTP